MTTTFIELRSDGAKVVFHRRGRWAWEHPIDDPYMIDSTEKGEVKQPCPTCSKPLKNLRRTTSPKTSQPS